MSVRVRDGEVDVALVAGPRTQDWPSVGVRTLSLVCSEFGLSVGVFGGEQLAVQGVIPHADVGGTLIAEDTQGRVHRVRARSIVRFSASAQFPDPFPGWVSEGLIPLQTAKRLLLECDIPWAPKTVILGTGNPAFRFGSQLLELGVSEKVLCVQSYARMEGEKDVDGWEVEKRRFEMVGGRILHAKPVHLESRGAMRWRLKLQDEQGLRIEEVARVVSAGPFRKRGGLREYPPGSLLFELEQTSESHREDDVEGWILEEERARSVALKLVRRLRPDLTDVKDKWESLSKRTRRRLKLLSAHQESGGFSLEFQGKWTRASDLEKIKNHPGTPKEVFQSRMVASAECVEDIACRLCEKACPEEAISIQRGGTEPSFLLESDCTACGKCLTACPSGAISMIHEKSEEGLSEVAIAYRGVHAWSEGQLAVLLNRRGDRLGTGRVSKVENTLVYVEIPSHLLWEARAIMPNQRGVGDAIVGIKRPASDENAIRVEVMLEGEKRLVREGLPLSLAFFELGLARAEDRLLCEDGSCALCDCIVDGTKQRACRTKTRKGMTVERLLVEEDQSDVMCPCAHIRSNEVSDSIENGKLRSPDIVASRSAVGTGKCHGQICSSAFRRMLLAHGIEEAEDWIDWRRPWREWVIN